MPGIYNVYANLFDACGARSVHFDVSVYRRVQVDDSTLRLERVERRAGYLLGQTANGGSEAPLYVTSVNLP